MASEPIEWRCFMTGIRCDNCNRRMKTVDSRPVAGGVRRRKECPGCGNRMSTVEKAVPSLGRPALRNVPRAMPKRKSCAAI